MINVDSTGIPLSNSDEVRYRRLFEALLKLGLEDRLRGNVTLSFDGGGGYGPMKVERFIDVASGMTSGNGKH